MKRSENQPPVTLSCINCDATYSAFASQVKWRGSSYCSMDCSREHRKKKPKKCVECEVEFLPRNPQYEKMGMSKFCSHKCQWSYSHKTNPRRFDFNCIICGKTFERFSANIRKGKPRYCSRACQGKGKVREGSTTSRGAGWGEIRQTVRRRDSDRCVKCGEPDATGRKLAVDHVIPWLLVKSDPSVGNHLDNLASLCSSCHGKKTSVVEPRLIRGDILALRNFYGVEIADRAEKNWGRLGKET